MISCILEDGAPARLRHVVVDTIVVKGDAVLLVKRARGLLEAGKWGLVGGFVERDETLRAAVMREVLEETGWRIEEPWLLRIVDDPTRPGEDRQNIAMVFVGEATEQAGTPDAESSAQRWWPVIALPPPNDVAFDHLASLLLFRDAKTRGPLGQN